MRLLLVMPTGMKTGYDEYFSTSPLGIEALAACARPYADVELADMRGKGQNVDAHADALLARAPDMIGLSINSAPHTKYALALAAALKRRRPTVQLLAGGQQATFLAEELLAPGHLDAIVRGEGERTLTDILSRGGEVRGVAGVSWRDASRVHHEEDRALIEDLDTLPFPARELLPDRRRYRMGAYRIEGIETSRGCPHRCSFCSVRNFHRGRWRPKSVDRVMSEIDSLLAADPAPRVIYFADDSFATDIRRVEQICRAIVQRRTDTHFWCQARGDALAAHPEVVEWMGRAKFAAVLMGVETPVDHLMAEARKGSSPGDIREAIKLLQAHDIGVWGTFVLGLPGETRAESEATAAAIPAVGADVVQITVATPIPGSELYEKAKANGQLLTRDWDNYDFTTPTMAGQLPKADMDALIHRAYLKSYVNLRFLRSLLSKRTNLYRLRRTALRVFSRWIGFLLHDRMRAAGRRLRRRLFGRVSQRHSDATGTNAG